ncbi:hypothetical protein LEA_20379, partial [human gut metagenome]
MIPLKRGLRSRKRYWTYALTQIHEAHGNPGSFSNVNPST